MKSTAFNGQLHIGALWGIEYWSMFYDFMRRFVPKEGIERIISVDDEFDPPRTHDPLGIVYAIKILTTQIDLARKGVEIEIETGNHGLPLLRSSFRRMLDELASCIETFNISWPKKELVRIRNWQGKRDFRIIPVTRHTYEIYGRNILVSSGHEFDPWWSNNSNKWFWTIKQFSKLETIFGTGIDYRLFDLYQKISSLLHRLSWKNFYTPNELVNMGGRDLLEANPEIDIVVLGQTHQRKLVIYDAELNEVASYTDNKRIVLQNKQRAYINVGAWPKNFDLTLLYEDGVTIDTFSYPHKPGQKA